MVLRDIKLFNLQFTLSFNQYAAATLQKTDVFVQDSGQSPCNEAIDSPKHQEVDIGSYL